MHAAWTGAGGSSGASDAIGPVWEAAVVVLGGVGR